MNTSDWTKFASDILHFIWLPLIIIIVSITTVAWVSPELYAVFISKIKNLPSEYNAMLENLDLLVTTLKIEMAPSIIAYSFVAVVFYFLRGPFFNFLEVLPPNIGWYSGTSLGFASQVELAALRKRYPHANSTTEAYSFATEELRNNESTKLLFEGTRGIEHYLINFSKLIVIMSVVVLLLQTTLFSANADFFFRSLVALFIAVLLWVCGAMFFVRKIMSSEYAIYRTIRQQLHKEIPNFENSNEEVTLEPWEIKFLNSRFWYIRLPTFQGSIQFLKIFISGFTFKS